MRDHAQDNLSRFAADPSQLEAPLNRAMRYANPNLRTIRFQYIRCESALYGSIGLFRKPRLEEQALHSALFFPSMCKPLQDVTRLHLWELKERLSKSPLRCSWSGLLRRIHQEASADRACVLCAELVGKANRASWSVPIALHVSFSNLQKDRFKAVWQICADLTIANDMTWPEISWILDGVSAFKWPQNFSLQ